MVRQIHNAVPHTANGGVPVEEMSELYLKCTFALAAFVGILQLLMGILRVGVFMNFVSEPVIAGFTSAAALLIASTQVRVCSCGGVAWPAPHPLDSTASPVLSVTR